MMNVGVDTGGTFTDFIYWDGRQWVVFKLPSTPDNPAEAVLGGLQQIPVSGSRQIAHGSTVATNTLLEQRGARTALITNAGFEDLIEIGRQNRSRLYDLAYRKQPHLVPAPLRFGVRGRVVCSGGVEEDLVIEEVREIRTALKSTGVESVAVCLLFSFLNPLHELSLGAELEGLGVPVSLSHQILCEFREFERTSTTVVNAYVAPRMRRYLSSLSAELAEGDRLRVLQSNGGSISAETARDEPVRTIFSGPAGGAVAAFKMGRMAGHEKLITFDMGGTSTDVSLMDGRLSLSLESRIAGYPVKVPMLDIHTVGAGGGSLAAIDPGGSLKVGPLSAGAEPGPICYGRGGDKITVTDANLYLGRLIPEHFLGGRLPLHPERLVEPFGVMARTLGCSPEELARGVLSVADATMERAIRVISVERGHDPGEFTLLSFGGAGGMHAVSLARSLTIPRVLVPRHPGALSALGMLLADILKDYSQTVMQTGTEAAEDLSGLFLPLEERAVAELETEGVPPARMVLERYLDMRYRGQSFEIIVPFGDDHVERFHRLHEKTYGYRNVGKEVEIVTVRLRARGVAPEWRFPKAGFVSERPPAEALLGEGKTVFDSRPRTTRIVDREKLFCGNRIEGPAVVVEYSSTTVLPPGVEASVDEYLNLVIETSL